MNLFYNFDFCKMKYKYIFFNLFDIEWINKKNLNLIHM